MNLRNIPFDELYENFLLPEKGTPISPGEAMDLAFRAALQGAGFVRSNPLVGAVLVNKDHRFVAASWHSKFGAAHAEQALLQKLKTENLEDELLGATLYSTLEPCAHQGKTPSCSHLLAKYPLKKIVYGRCDNTKKVSGNGLKHLELHGIKTEFFPSTKNLDLADKLKFLTEHFECYEEKRKPFVAIKVASTLNGIYAHTDSKKEWITGERSRKYAHFLRLLSDTIVVGARTIIQDNPSLTDRFFQKERIPLRVVLDPKGEALFSQKLSEHSILKEKSKIFWWINLETYNKISSTLMKESETRGICFKVFEGNTKEEKLAHVCQELYTEGQARILLEGGGSLWSSALNSKLCEKLYLFQAPKIFSGDHIMHWTKDAKIQYLNLKNSISTLLDKDTLIEGLTDEHHTL